MTIARIGASFLVNTTTNATQSVAVIQSLPDGRFVVVWQDNSMSGPDTTAAIRARIFNADGSESVAEFVANSATIGPQYEPSVAVLSDGRFMVTWTDYSQTGGDASVTAVRGRIFNADGSESVPEFRVNTTTAETQQQSSVTALSDGRFMVTWTDYSETAGPSSGFDVRARIFNANGTESVPEFVVNSTLSEPQINSDVMELADGRILVSWTDNSETGGDTENSAIRARIFNANGTESVPEFLVNATTASSQVYSDIAALSSGGFVIVWADYSATGDDPSGSSIRASVFDADGTVSVAEFVVNTTTFFDQNGPAIAAMADGRFIITWTDFSATAPDTLGIAIRARIFNADGTQSVPEFLVNTTVTGDQTGSRVTVLADGRIAITWSDNSGAFGDPGFGIAAQIFDPTLYDGSAAGDLANGGSFDDRYTGYAGNDTLAGRGGDDRLYGGEGEDSLSGDEGDDTLDGGNGGDNAFGGAGIDYIYGRSGNELLYGGTEGDHLWGGTGGDAHYGGDGIDYARYDDANHGNLVIRLDNPGGNTGAAAGDTYTGIEGLVGGAGNDLVVGDGQNNFLFGSGGADQVYGGVGNDYLSGDAGGDNLWGGTGADAHYGGNDAGVDYARYDDANHGNLTLRLDNSAGNAGTAAVGDTYTGIEGLVGGAGNDVVIGNTAANFLFGQGGADFIDGQGGNDYLNGGAGADRFRFSTALGANIDSIADFQHLVDDILLVQSIFAGIGVALTADEFRIGMALDANDRILYNNGTGQIFYDSNANAAGGMILFATVTAGTVLTFDDFIMV